MGEPSRTYGRSVCTTSRRRRVRSRASEKSDRKRQELGCYRSGEALFRRRHARRCSRRRDKQRTTASSSEERHHEASHNTACIAIAFDSAGKGQFQYPFQAHNDSFENLKAAHSATSKNRVSTPLCQLPDHERHTKLNEDAIV